MKAKPRNNEERKKRLEGEKGKGQEEGNNCNE